MSWENVLTNPYSWMALRPYNWVSTWGDGYQFNVLPERFSYNEAMMFHGILSPNHVSQWNPMFAIPMQENTTNPIFTAEGQKISDKYVNNSMNAIFDRNAYFNTNNLLKSLDGKFKQILENENLPEEQRTKIQEFADQEEALQEVLDEYKTAMEDSTADRTELANKLWDTKRKADKLRNDSVKAIEEFDKELAKLEKKEKDEKKAKDDNKGETSTGETLDCRG